MAATRCLLTGCAWWPCNLIYFQHARSLLHLQGYDSNPAPLPLCTGGPLFAPRTAGRPYDTAIGLVSCAFPLFLLLLLIVLLCGLLAAARHESRAARRCVRRSPCCADGINCKLLYDRLVFGKPGVYTNIAQLRKW